MGRKPWTDRLCVEDCPVRLSVRDLARDGVLEFSYKGLSSYSTKVDGVEIARFHFRRYDNISGYSLYFPPQIFRTSEPRMRSAGQMVHLSGSRCVGTRRRFWFSCQCGQWAAILYLPPGTTEFRCRNCWNLTYRTCQVRQERPLKLRRGRNTGTPAAFKSFDELMEMFPRKPKGTRRLVEMPDFLKTLK